MNSRRLLIAFVLLLTTSCTTPKAPAPPSPSPSPSGVSIAALRRPWAHPPIAPGSPCPVTTTLSQPDPGLAALLGDGPARAAGLAPGAVLEYKSPLEGGDWIDKTWGGKKVLWAIDPTLTGPVLIRGRQLDGPGQVAFEDPVMLELVLNTGSYEGQVGGWKDNPGYTRVRSPGCYAYQIDSERGSSTIVFIARGPVM